MHITHVTLRNTDKNDLPISIFSNVNKQSVKKNQRPIVLLVHGGCWLGGKETNLHDMAQFLVTQLDVVAVSISYTLTNVQMRNMYTMMALQMAATLLLFTVCKRNNKYMSLLLMSLITLLILGFAVTLDSVDETKHPSHMYDIVRCIRYIHIQLPEIIENVDTSSMSLVAHSAGAHLTALAVSDTSYLINANINPSIIKGVVLLSGIYAQKILQRSTFRVVSGFIFGSDNDTHMAFPLNYISNKTCPMFVIVSGADFSIISHGRALVEQLKQHRVPYAYYCSMHDSHFSIKNNWNADSIVGQKVVTFLHKILKI